MTHQKYGRQGQADFVLYPLAAQFPLAFHDVTHGTNSVPCNIDTVSIEGSSYAPTDCIAVSNPITVDNFTSSIAGQTTEGQIGSGTTAEYNATAGYDMGSGLGTVDANVLLTNWGNVPLIVSSSTDASKAKTTPASPTG